MAAPETARKVAHAAGVAEGGAVELAVAAVGGVGAQPTASVSSTQFHPSYGHPEVGCESRMYDVPPDEVNWTCVGHTSSYHRIASITQHPISLDTKERAPCSA